MVPFREVDPLIMPIVNLGAVGAVLVWFMFRAERKFEQMANSIDRLSRTMLIGIIGSSTVAPHAKESAQSVLRDIETANGNGGH